MEIAALMILLVGVSILVAVLAFVYGSTAIISLDRLFSLGNERQIPLSLINVTGMMILALIAGYTSIFISIGLVAIAGVSLLAVFLYKVNRHAINQLASHYLRGLRSQNRLAILTFLLVYGLIIVESAVQPKVGDSGLYHVQTIKWIENFGVVPGLGNLHGMYAWNSMWYPLSALFAFSFVGIESLHILNGMLFLFAAAYFIGGMTSVLKGQFDHASILKVSAIPLFLFVYRPQIGSPSTDMPAALMVSIAFILFLENLNPDRTFRSRTTNVIIVAIIAYSLTIKLSVLPILLLGAYLAYLQYRLKEWTVMLMQVGLGAAFLIPWVGRNIMLSGYLVYPFPYIDLFDVDWKLPFQYVMEEKFVQHGWARLPSSEWRYSLDMSPSEWIPKWLDWLPYNYKLSVLATTAIAFAHLGVKTLNSRRWRDWTDSHMVLWMIAFVGMIYWFVNAPDPRFGFGFMLIAGVLPLVSLIKKLLARSSFGSRLVALSIIGLYIMNHGYLSIRSLPGTVDTVLMPAPYPREDLESWLVDGIVFYSPMSTDQCWYAPLPCTPVLNSQLRLRGGELASGFRIVQTEEGARHELPDTE